MQFNIDLKVSIWYDAERIEIRLFSMDVLQKEGDTSYIMCKTAFPSKSMT